MKSITEEVRALLKKLNVFMPSFDEGRRMIIAPDVRKLSAFIDAAQVNIPSGKPIITHRTDVFIRAVSAIVLPEFCKKVCSFDPGSSSAQGEFLTTELAKGRVTISPPITLWDGVSKEEGVGSFLIKDVATLLIAVFQFVIAMRQAFLEYPRILPKDIYLSDCESYKDVYVTFLSSVFETVNVKKFLCGSLRPGFLLPYGVGHFGKRLNTSSGAQAWKEEVFRQYENILQEEARKVELASKLCLNLTSLGSMPLGDERLPSPEMTPRTKHNMLFGLSKLLYRYTAGANRAIHLLVKTRDRQVLSFCRDTFALDNDSIILALYRDPSEYRLLVDEKELALIRSVTRYAQTLAKLVRRAEMYGRYYAKNIKAKPSNAQNYLYDPRPLYWMRQEIDNEGAGVQCARDFFRRRLAKNMGFSGDDLIRNFLYLLRGLLVNNLTQGKIKECFFKTLVSFGGFIRCEILGEGHAFPMMVNESRFDLQEKILTGNNTSKSLRSYMAVFYLKEFMPLFESPQAMLPNGELQLNLEIEKKDKAIKPKTYESLYEDVQKAILKKPQAAVATCGTSKRSSPVKSVPSELRVWPAYCSLKVANQALLDLFDYPALRVMLNHSRALTSQSVEEVFAQGEFRGELLPQDIEKIKVIVRYANKLSSIVKRVEMCCRFYVVNFLKSEEITGCLFYGYEPFWTAPKVYSKWPTIYTRDFFREFLAPGQAFSAEGAHQKFAAALAESDFSALDEGRMEHCFKNVLFRYIQKLFSLLCSRDKKTSPLSKFSSELARLKSYLALCLRDELCPLVENPRLPLCKGDTFSVDRTPLAQLCHDLQSRLGQFESDFSEPKSGYDFG